MGAIHIYQPLLTMQTLYNYCKLNISTLSFSKLLTMLNTQFKKHHTTHWACK